MPPIRLPDLTPTQFAELDPLFRTTRTVRLRTHAQTGVLAAEQRLTAPAITAIVLVDAETGWRWRKRYGSEGPKGRRDVPRPGAPVATESGLPYSLGTLQRVADGPAEQTGVRVAVETVRLHLKAAGIVLSRSQHTIASRDPEYALSTGDRSRA